MSFIRNSHHETELLDVDQVAEMINCSRSHVRRMSDDGRLPPSVKVGRLRRWPLKAIESWLASGCGSRRVTPTSCCDPPAESLPRLTDEEIEAIEYMAAMHSVDNHPICRRHTEVLDALLRRLGAKTVG